jgi:hypothetical protein
MPEVGTCGQFGHESVNSYVQSQKGHYFGPLVQQMYFLFDK